MGCSVENEKASKSQNWRRYRARVTSNQASCAATFSWWKRLGPGSDVDRATGDRWQRSPAARLRPHRLSKSPQPPPARDPVPGSSSQASVHNWSTTPLGLPGTDWGGDPTPWPGMGEREGERVTSAPNCHLRSCMQPHIMSAPAWDSFLVMCHIINSVLLCLCAISVRRKSRSIVATCECVKLAVSTCSLARLLRIGQPVNRLLSTTWTRCGDLSIKSTRSCENCKQRLMEICQK